MESSTYFMPDTLVKCSRKLYTCIMSNLLCLALISGQIVMAGNGIAEFGNGTDEYDRVIGFSCHFFQILPIAKPHRQTNTLETTIHQNLTKNYFKKEL